VSDDLAQRLVPLRPEGSGAPLYCVHAVSGSAYSYAGLARLLGEDIPVYGIEAPGFDDGREPVRSLPALAREYAHLLRAVRPEGGHRLLGWSMGGVIAFEVARLLTAAGLDVAQVVLVDAGLPWVAPMPPEREVQRTFLRDLAGMAGFGPEGINAVVDLQPEDAAEAATFAAIEESGVLPEELDAEILEERYTVFRALREALSAFEVTGGFDGPVLHLIAQASQRRYMRWDTVATNLTERVVPGDHYSVWTGPGLAEMGAAIDGVLGGA
jgi:thioesterase domain-containing protein